MKVAKTSQVHNPFGGSAGQDDPSPATIDPPAEPTLDPELVSRFHALIEEVTDALMDGRDVDRRICRADAVALLMATCEQLDPPPEVGESPLRYLLLEEQHKTAAALGQAGLADHLPTLLKV
jgi:hypothetical protein